MRRRMLLVDFPFASLVLKLFDGLMIVYSSKGGWLWRKRLIVSLTIEVRRFVMLLVYSMLREKVVSE